jgi:two-component system response regulator GlrR
VPRRLQDPGRGSEERAELAPPAPLNEHQVDDPIQFGGMVGRSAAMRSLFGLLERSAASDATVLIEGETGTGKDTSAEAIHREGSRRNGPFIAVDCGALAPQLLEVELFGAGLRTTSSARKGAFEAATGGTLFLDDVGELSLDLQPKLLQMLERRHLGLARKASQPPARVIAATRRSLRAELAAGRFRSDLYYRLAVVQVKLPPLRERLSDLPLLVEDVLTRLGRANDPIAGALLLPEFADRLAGYRWPGNVRQLRSYIERCVATSDPNLSPGTGTIPPEAAEEDRVVDPNKPLRLARHQWNETCERRYLEAVLVRNDDNISAAARTAGVDRIHFYRLLWKHGLRPHHLDPSEGASGVKSS